MVRMSCDLCEALLLVLNRVTVQMGMKVPGVKGVIIVLSVACRTNLTNVLRSRRRQRRVV